MTARLWAFYTEAVATDKTAYRPGARHVVIILAMGEDIATARALGLQRCEANGWMAIDIKRQKEAGNPASDFPEGPLRQAGLDALENGVALISYKDEIPPHS